jgi:hypothetical protein
MVRPAQLILVVHFDCLTPILLFPLSAAQLTNQDQVEAMRRSRRGTKFYFLWIEGFMEFHHMFSSGCEQKWRISIKDVKSLTQLQLSEEPGRYKIICN